MEHDNALDGTETWSIWRALSLSICLSVCLQVCLSLQPQLLAMPQLLRSTSLIDAFDSVWSRRKSSRPLASLCLLVGYFLHTHTHTHTQTSSLTLSPQVWFRAPSLLTIIFGVSSQIGHLRVWGCYRQSAHWLRDVFTRTGAKVCACVCVRARVRCKCV